MSEDTRTPAQLSASVSLSVTDGSPGIYSWVGTKMAETSAGQKRSGWNYSSELFSNIAHSQVSKYSETTLELSKVGGQAGVETLKPTESSNEFTNYWKKATLSSPRDMSTQSTIPQTDPQGVYIPPDTYSFPQSTSQAKSDPSLATLTSRSEPTK